jgi:plasmanylethanolamine desaturase
MLSILLQALAVLLVLDLGSGLVHWAEDTFFSESTPIVGAWLVAPNVLHHRDGGAFVDRSWWQSNWDCLLFCAAAVAAAALAGVLSWHVWLFAAVGSNANQLHKWAHAPRGRVPAPVRGLQRLGVLQSPAQHALHHVGAKNTRYCVVTTLLNPVLDAAGFWRGLEACTVPLLGAPRRTDLARWNRSAA